MDLAISDLKASEYVETTTFQIMIYVTWDIVKIWMVKWSQSKPIQLATGYSNFSKIKPVNMNTLL